MARVATFDSRFISLPGYAAADIGRVRSRKRFQTRVVRKKKREKKKYARSLEIFASFPDTCRVLRRFASRVVAFDSVTEAVSVFASRSRGRVLGNLSLSRTTSSVYEDRSVFPIMQEDRYLCLTGSTTVPHNLFINESRSSGNIYPRDYLRFATRSHRWNSDSNQWIRTTR